MYNSYIFPAYWFLHTIMKYNHTCIYIMFLICIYIYTRINIMPSFVHLENLDMVWKSTHILSIDFTQRPEHHVEPMYNLSEAQVWPLAWSFHGMLFQSWATLKPCDFQDRTNFWLLSLWWSYSTPLGCAENILAFFGFLFFCSGGWSLFPSAFFVFSYNGQPLHYRDAL